MFDVLSEEEQAASQDIGIELDPIGVWQVDAQNSHSVDGLNIRVGEHLALPES